MFNFPRRAICSSIKHTPHMPFSYLNTFIFTHPVSTRSTSGHEPAVKKALNQFHTSQDHHPGNAAAWPSAARRKLRLEQPNRAEQLVWLAKRSLAACSAQNAVSTDRSDKHVPSHEKRDIATSPTLDCTNSWDGPTVWAHLWEAYPRSSFQAVD
jgi:hypothetical protein